MQPPCTTLSDVWETHTVRISPDSLSWVWGHATPNSPQLFSAVWSFACCMVLCSVYCFLGHTGMARPKNRGSQPHTPSGPWLYTGPLCLVCQTRSLPQCPDSPVQLLGKDSSMHSLSFDRQPHQWVFFLRGGGPNQASTRKIWNTHIFVLDFIFSSTLFRPVALTLLLPCFLEHN